MGFDPREPDPKDLVASVSLQVGGADCLAMLECCLPLARELGAVGVDVNAQPCGEDPGGVATLYVPLGVQASWAYHVSLREGAAASGPLLARFGWRAEQIEARSGPEHRGYLEVVAPPVPMIGGTVVGLAVTTWSGLVYELRDGLDGDETVDNVGRCRRFLEPRAETIGVPDIVVRVHAVVAAPHLDAAAERLARLAGEPAPVAISLDKDARSPGVVHGALLYVVAGSSDLRQVAVEVAARFGLADHSYRVHEVREWEVGAIEGVWSGEARPEGEAVAVYARLGVDPFADYGVLALPEDDLPDEAQSLPPQEEEFSEEDAREFMRTMEQVMPRVVLVAEFVGVSSEQARTGVERLLREAFPGHDDEDVFSELYEEPRQGGVLVGAVSTSGVVGRRGPAMMLLAVRAAVGQAGEWTVQVPPDDDMGAGALRWQGAGESGMVRLEVYAGRGVGLRHEP